MLVDVGYDKWVVLMIVYDLGLEIGDYLFLIMGFVDKFDLFKLDVLKVVFIVLLFLCCW